MRTLIATVFVCGVTVLTTWLVFWLGSAIGVTHEGTSWWEGAYIISGTVCILGSLVGSLNYVASRS